MSDTTHHPKILVLAGSARLDSLNRKLARQTVEALRSAGLEATLADLRDFSMPMYDGDLEAGQGLPPAAKALKELARRHDGFAIASPEYNGSFPALLKNALDWISRPEQGEHPLQVFRGKVAAILSASPGPGGGRRGLRHLRELLEMMSVSVVPRELAIARASGAFDADGRLTRPEDLTGLQELAAALAQSAAQRQEAAV
ncbi:MAG: NAD(P)H-dependent oxidoreductase [Candidatus Solibacter sp.]|nr:NAD(P)H-dependent oxidoreductase [Candidatus Solibacter sp.]